MAKPTAWMPMYWGDYLRDTGHLSTHQHGAYLLLIAYYWSSGQALPDDDLRLSNITRIPPHLWKRVRPTLSAFFKLENGHWYHERIERELTVAFGNKAAATARARHAAATRWRDAPSMPQAIVEHTSSPSPRINHESDSENLTDAARDPARPGGSGPRASRAETGQERLARLALEARQKLLRSGGT